MTLIASTQAVPVIMYHNIRCPKADSPPVIEHLALDRPVFRAHLDEIQRMGYRTVTLDDLWSWKQSKNILPARSIVLTFDDGYLDNWLLAHSELEKRGMCATVFVNPEFVRPDDVPPAQTGLGYVSWAELRAMIDSGVWRVESHTLTHNFSFISSRIIDYHRPGSDYYWLYWLERPERKPFWIDDNWVTQVPYGRPVYEFNRTLSGPIYHEDPVVRQTLETYVRERGGADFFNDPSWREQLDRVANDALACSTARMENSQQLEDRVLFELVESKHLLESHLGQPVNHVCWPGGGFQPQWCELALSAGYRSYTLSSQYRGINTQDTPAEQVKRLSFSHNLGIWHYFPFHMGERLTVQAKLRSMQGQKLWKLMQMGARQMRSLRKI